MDGEKETPQDTFYIEDPMNGYVERRKSPVGASMPTSMDTAARHHINSKEGQDILAEKDAALKAVEADLKKVEANKIDKNAKYNKPIPVAPVAVCGADGIAVTAIGGDKHPPRSQEKEKAITTERLTNHAVMAGAQVLEEGVEKGKSHMFDCRYKPSM